MRENRKKKEFHLVIMAVVDMKPHMIWTTDKVTKYLEKMVLNLIQVACEDHKDKINNPRFKNIKALSFYGLKLL